MNSFSGNKKRAGLSLALLFFSSAFLTAEADLTVYYTSSLNGNLIGCECKGVPKAGLSTTASFLRTVNPEKSLIINLGDFCDARADELLSDTIIMLYDDIGYEISAVGDQEFGSGVDYFNSIDRRLDFLCNNMKVDGRMLSETPRIIEKNGIRLGVASVIEPSVFFFYPDEVKTRIEIAEPAASAADALIKLQNDNADYNMLLFHGRVESARKIFSEESGWDAILVAHEQMLIEENAGIRIFASPGEEGNRIGMISLDFRFGRLKNAENTLRYFKYEKDPEDEAVLQAFEDYKNKLIENLKNGTN